MKRIITIAAILVLMFSTSFAQQMKWKKLADRILRVFYNGIPQFTAIEAKGTTILAGWENVVLSTDGGITWTQLSIPWINVPDYVRDVAIYDDQTFAIGSTTGIYHSSDRGTTWKIVGNVNSTSIIFDDSPNKLIAIGDKTIHLFEIGKQTISTKHDYFLSDIQHGADKALYIKSGDFGISTIYKSADHGLTWTEFSRLPQTDFDCFSLICDRVDPNRFVVVNEDWAARGNGFSETFVTSDAGQSWITTLKEPLGNITYLKGNAAQGCNDYFVGTHSNGILRSNDKGITWQSIGGPTTPVDSRSLFAVDDSIIFAIDDSGSIWRTDVDQYTLGIDPIIGDSAFRSLSLPLCDTASISSIIFNPTNGCSPAAAIDSVLIIGRDSLDYSLEHQLTSPSTLPDSVTIRFTPSKVGATDAQLKITYSNGEVRFVDLTTTVLPPATLSLTNVSNVDISTDTLGGDITIPIQLKKSLDMNAEFLIHYDTTYLLYRGTFDELGINHTKENINGRVRIGYNPSVDTSLYASFSFFPVDSSCTSVRIDSISSLDSSACVVIENKVITATICGPEGCGINALSKFIRYGTTPEFSITPNPTRGTITLRSNMDIDGATIEIRNEVGAITYSSRSDIKQANGLSLDVSGLLSGAYILRITTEGGSSSTKFIKSE